MDCTLHILNTRLFLEKELMCSGKQQKCKKKRKKKKTGVNVASRLLHHLPAMSIAAMPGRASMLFPGEKMNVSCIKNKSKLNC